MFTGLVQDLGRSRRSSATADGARLTIATPLAAELAEGDSIAVNGVCLTAVEPSPTARSRADVMNETLRRSSLGARRAGRR